MARKPRVYAKGIPCHVVQRGNNRQACFYCDDDFGFYMQSLNEALKRYQSDPRHHFKNPLHYLSSGFNKLRADYLVW